MIDKLLKIMLTISILLSLVFFSLKSDIQQYWSASNWVEMLFPLALLIGYLSLLAWRNKWLLLVQKMHISWIRLLAMQIIGLAINYINPKFQSGDYMIINQIQLSWPERETELKAIKIFEKLNDIAALLLLSIIGGVYLYSQYGQLSGLLISLSLAIVFIIIMVELRAYSNQQDKRPFIAKWFQCNRATIDQLKRLISQPSLLRLTFYLAFILQLLLVITYWYCFQIIYVEPPFLIIAMIVALPWLASYLPIAVNGLGIKEGLMVLTFTAIGIKLGEALAAIWLGLSLWGVMISIGFIILGIQRLLKK